MNTDPSQMHTNAPGQSFEDTAIGASGNAPPPAVASEEVSSTAKRASIVVTGSTAPPSEVTTNVSSSAISNGSNTAAQPKAETLGKMLAAIHKFAEKVGLKDTQEVTDAKKKVNDLSDELRIKEPLLELLKNTQQTNESQSISLEDEIKELENEIFTIKEKKGEQEKIIADSKLTEKASAAFNKIAEKVGLKEPKEIADAKMELGKLKGEFSEKMNRIKRLEAQIDDQSALLEAIPFSERNANYRVNYIKKIFDLQQVKGEVVGEIHLLAKQISVQEKIIADSKVAPQKIQDTIDTSDKEVTDAPLEQTDESNINKSDARNTDNFSNSQLEIYSTTTDLLPESTEVNDLESPIIDEKTTEEPNPFVSLVSGRETKKQVLSNDVDVVEAVVKQLNPENPIDKTILELYRNEGSTLLVLNLMKVRGQTANLEKIFEMKSMNSEVITFIEKGKFPMAVKALDAAKKADEYINVLDPNKAADKKLLDLYKKDGATPLFKYLYDAKISSKDNPIDKQIVKLFKNEGTTPLVKNLLLARARGQEALLKGAFESNDPQIMKFIEHGQFSLALEKLGAPDINIWAIPDVSIGIIAKLQNLNADLKGVDGHEDMMSWAIDYARNHEEKDTLKTLGQVQFLLARSPQVQTILGLANDNHLGETVKEIMQKRVLIEGKLGHTQSAEVTLQIAMMLTSLGGHLITDIIDEMQEVLNQQKEIDPAIKESIMIKLDALKNHPEFADRLTTLTSPTIGSRQEILIGKLVGNDPQEAVTARDAKLAVLSALLWPLRQGNVGTCFSTSLVIQQGSHAEGLKQNLEDLLSIVGNGCLTRKVSPPKNGTIDTPLIIPNLEEFAMKFKGDNLLARAHEYTMVNSGSSKLAGRFLNDAMNNIGKQVASEISDSQIRNEMLANLNARCCTIYDVEKNRWAVVDSQTGRNFSTMEPEDAAKFFGKLIEHKEGITDELSDFIGSNDFSHLWLRQQRSLVGGVGTGGDNVGTLLSTDVKKLDINFRDESSIENVFTLVSMWSDEEKDYARQNQGLLIPHETKEHSFSLRAHTLITLYDSANGDPKQVFINLQKKAEAFVGTQVTREILNEFLESYTKLYSSRYKYADKIPEGVESYKEKIIREVLKHENPTIQTIYETMNELDYNTNWLENGEADWSKRVEQVLRSLPSLKNSAPEVYNVFDSNWATKQQRGFTMSIFSGKITPMVLQDNPLDISDWSFIKKANQFGGHVTYKFEDPVRNALSRNYYQPKANV